MTETADDLVWYAAYGSNLAHERFLAYLAGGPIPGSPAGRVQAGARDATPPGAWHPIEFAGQLYFAENSRHWGGGGVAFVDLDGQPGTVLARAWKVTVSQLADVYRQENGLPVPDEPFDAIDEFVRAVADGDTGPGAETGWYRRLARCATVDGLAVITFTSAHRRRPSRPPSPSYRSVIAAGLTQTWRLDPDQVEAYLTIAGAPASVEP